MFVIFKKVRRRNTDNSWKIYSKEAKTLINSIIEKYNKDNLFIFNRISIRNQRTRWGSCSSRKNLNFNYRIVKLPIELAEYLVVHELCHLKHMNHSKDYWKLVESILPNYKILQKKLKKHII